MGGIDRFEQEKKMFISGINPRNRKESFEVDEKGGLINKKGENVGKIRYIKTRGVLQIKMNFTQEIKVLKQKKLKK